MSIYWKVSRACAIGIMAILSTTGRTQTTTMNAVEALLQAARHGKIQLGIICDDRNTLQAASVSYSEGQSIDQIVSTLKGYIVEKNHGIPIVRPRTFPKITAQMLSTKIEDFKTGPATMSQMNLTLWMDLQLKVADPKPETFWGVLHTNDQQITAGLTLTDQTVQSVLNNIVEVGKDSSWVVLPPPSSLNNTPQDRLWGIIRYQSASSDASIHDLCCLKWQYLEQ